MSNLPASISFNYAALPADLANDARKIAGRIRGRIKTGEHLRPKDVAAIASDARHRANEEEAQVKRLPKGKAARERAMAAQAVAAERREAREAAEERARAELMALIVDALGDAGGKALLLLNRIPHLGIADQLKTALEKRAVAS